MVIYLSYDKGVVSLGTVQQDQFVAKELTPEQFSTAAFWSTISSHTIVEDGSLFLLIRDMVKSRVKVPRLLLKLIYGKPWDLDKLIYSLPNLYKAGGFDKYEVADIYDYFDCPPTAPNIYKLFLCYEFYKNQND